MTLSDPTRRAVVVYESMFGCTAAIASAVARGLREEGVEVACSDVGAADPAGCCAGADLLVLGAPTHAFTLSSPGTREDAVRRGAPKARAAFGLRDWLASAVPGDDAPVVATFDTRLAVFRLIPVAAAATAARMARRRGFRVLDEPIGFIVEETTGPLAEGELARAETWGRSLAAAAGKVASGSG